TQDGTLFEQHEYADGQFDGLQQEWHANGKPKSRSSYIKGTASGTYEQWDENGTLVKSGKYDNVGKPTGLWLEQYSGYPRKVHYGPNDFISRDLVKAYVDALAGNRANAETVAFYLDDGQ